MHQLLEQLGDEQKRHLEGATERGASAWLSCLPLKCLGYDLSKRDFQDAICLRYGWRVKHMPKHCGCGSVNDIEHALICKKGGFIIMRHNAVRDSEAAIMKEVTKDVQIEPMLMPVGNVELSAGSNVQNNAKSDVSARGLWSIQEKTFFDIRITHPYAPSHARKSSDTLLKENENSKMREYNDRVLQIEKASFVPLIYTTNGGMGPQCLKMHKQLARLIAAKRKERYSTVMEYVRTRIRFALLKSTLVAIRGYRGTKGKYDGAAEIAEIDFGVVDVGSISDS